MDWIALSPNAFLILFIPVRIKLLPTHSLTSHQLSSVSSNNKERNPASVVSLQVKARKTETRPDEMSSFEKNHDMPPPPRSDSSPGYPKEVASISTIEENMSCEVKQYEARYDADGKRHVKEVVLHNPGEDEKDEGKFALRYFNYYTRDGNLEKTTLEVSSPHIKKALRKVIGSWPDQNLTGRVNLSGRRPWEALDCLVHYRKELGEYAAKLEDTTARKHVQLVIDFVGTELKKDICRFHDNLELSEKPCVEFRDIWMLFRRDHLVFGGHGPEKYLNKVVKVTYDSGGMMSCPKWIVIAKAFVHDGINYGFIHRQLIIPMFNNSVELSKLPFLPFQYHEDPRPFLDYLLTRGKKYHEHVGVQYRSYDGVVTMVDRQRTVNFSGRVRDTFPEEVTKVRRHCFFFVIPFRLSYPTPTI
jgi:hypothetical protein